MSVAGPVDWDQVVVDFSTICESFRSISCGGGVGRGYMSCRMCGTISQKKRCGQRVCISGRPWARVNKVGRTTRGRFEWAGCFTFRRLRERQGLHILGGAPPSLLDSSSAMPSGRRSPSSARATWSTSLCSEAGRRAPKPREPNSHFREARVVGSFVLLCLL